MTNPGAVDLPLNGAVAKVPAVVETRGLSKRFGAVVASDAADLVLRAGEIHALIGPNGAGKSTIIKLITGEIQADAGTVLFDGLDVTAWPAARRVHAGLARTFQISSLALDLSALENVMLAVVGRSGTAFRFFRPALSERDLVGTAMLALEQAGIAERASVAAGTLSHGERRLLEIAIALALTPKAFLLDEPMAGLGATGSAELTRFLDTLRQTAPILLIEHDMDAVFSLADRVSVLVAGKVIASGTVDHIRGDPRVRDAYLGGDG